MASHRRPMRLAEVITLADRAGERRRRLGEARPRPEVHRAVLAAAETAARLLEALASQGDAHGVLRVAEALCRLGQGETTRATAILDEVLSGYRGSPA